MNIASAIALIKTNYARPDSRNFTTLLNADHAAIQAALSNLGSTATGTGRVVEGNDPTDGRAVPAVPDSLFLQVPNATYFIDGAPVEVAETAGFKLIPVAPNLTAGKYFYLSKSTTGSVEVLPANISDTPLQLAGKPCLGLVKSDAQKVVSVDYLLTDEVLQPQAIYDAVKLLQKLIDDLPGGGGASDGNGATLGQFAALQAQVDALTLTVAGLQSTNADGTTTVTVQSPNERTRAALGKLELFLARLTPAYAQVSDSAMLIPGVTGYAQQMPDGSVQPQAGSGNALRDTKNQRIS